MILKKKRRRSQRTRSPLQHATPASHRSWLQGSGMAADPVLAGSGRGGKRKMTANRKTTNTNEMARYE